MWCPGRAHTPSCSGFRIGLQTFAQRAQTLQRRKETEGDESWVPAVIVKGAPVT